VNANSTEVVPAHMMHGPSLIFDKSSVESLNLDEAVLLDNFYSSVITPIFFVGCLVDLEKNIRSKSTPEQLARSLAERTPECGCSVTVHCLLRAELCGRFNLSWTLGRPYLYVAGGRTAPQCRMRRGIPPGGSVRTGKRASLKADYGLSGFYKRLIKLIHLLHMKHSLVLMQHHLLV